MGYTYTCNGCGDPGETPALMGQFNKGTWLDEEFGDRMQSKGYELGDTVTICPTCALDFLEDQR
jgi:hypothetical protein